MKEKIVKRVFDFFDTPIEKLELHEAENSIDQLYALCDDPMQCPVKLVDEQLRFTDLTSVQDLFVENTGFLVVGVLGLQGCGKSTLLNILANQLTERTTPFDGPFKVQSMQNLITNSPETGGIDLYITQDRVILLDTQPLMSFALTNYHTRTASVVSSGHLDVTTAAPNENATATTLSGPGNWSLDVWAEMASLQMIAFLLNCCHVVLVVSDDVGNSPSQLHRLIDRAAGLKPTVYTPSILPPASMQPHRRKPPAKATTTLPGHVDPPGASTKQHTLSGVGTACVSESPTDEEAEVDEAEDDDDDAIVPGEDSASYAPERNRTARSGSDGQDVTVGPSGLLQAQRSPRAMQRAAHLEVESSDVAVALNRLRNLTDYSASLIHVYNQAPSAAFLDPLVRGRLHTYQHQLLPQLYPEYRRLVAMVTIGPRILSNHLVTSRKRNRSMNKAATSGSTRTVAATVAASTTTTTTTRVAPETEAASLDAVRSNASEGNNVAPATADALAFSVSASLVDQDADQGPELRDTAALSPHSSALSEAEHPSNSSSDPNRSQHSAEPDAGSGVQNKGDATEGEGGDGLKRDVTESSSALNVAASEVPETALVPQPGATNTSNSALGVCETRSKGDPTRPHGPSEAELVAELRTVLREVEADVSELVGPRHMVHGSDAAGSSNGCPASDGSLSSSDDESLPVLSEQLNGERLNARLAQLTHRIQSIRRQFFNVQQRLSHPRFFLVPEVDEEGRSPTGCPSYAASIRLLQEAILSTPRQHMMHQFTERKWIAYAQKMWEAVCTSPLLADYHAVLTNRM